MQSNALVLMVRYLLRDTGRGLATSSRVYGDDEILSALMGARAQVFGDLLMRQQLPRVSLRKLMTFLPVATVTTPAPADFCSIIYGIDASGSILPGEDTIRGLSFEGGPLLDYVAVVGGAFVGTATSAVYYRFPTQPITNTNTTLTEFGDAVYHCIKYVAVANLMLKERADVLLRLQFIQGEIKRKMMSLK